jgi:histone-lysine N-methyltransferase SETMAR
LIIYDDNTNLHTARATQTYFKQHSLKKTPDPPYWPDLAPSDFFLFDNVKRLFAGQLSASPDELLAAMLEILRGIPQDTLIRSFREWMSRLSKAIGTNGEYID